MIPSCDGLPLQLGMIRATEKLKKNIYPYLFILPAFVFLFVFTYWPLVNSFHLSLMRYDIAISQPIFNGVRNYVKMFSSSLFWQVMRNTIIYSSVTVFFSVSLGLLLSVLISSKKIRFKGFFRFSLFYSYILPTAAASMVWLWIYNPSFGIFVKFALFIYIFLNLLYSFLDIN